LEQCPQLFSDNLLQWITPEPGVYCFRESVPQGSPFRRQEHLLIGSDLYLQPAQCFPMGRKLDAHHKRFLAARMGLTTVQCDLVAGDPDPAVTADRMVRSVSQRARNGSIILMHMNGRGWHTAAALPGVIDELTRRGFAFTTVSELIRSPR
jgi:hypothetical protein